MSPLTLWKLGVPWILLCEMEFAAFRAAAALRCCWWNAVAFELCAVGTHQVAGWCLTEIIRRRELTMAADPKFKSDIQTSAHFLQARAALVDGEPTVILDFEMLDFEPSPTSVGL